MPAGFRSARRCASCRPPAWSTLQANRGAWVTRIDLRDCELSYEIRERIEPLLLRQQPARSDGRGPRRARTGAGRDRGHRRRRGVPGPRPGTALASYRHSERAASSESIIARLWDTTQHYRRAFSSARRAETRRWIINAEHRLLVQALRDGDAVEAERILETHIRRTRIELRAHPEVFDTGFDMGLMTERTTWSD